MVTMTVSLKHKLLNSAIFTFNRVIHPMTLGVRVMLMERESVVLVRHRYGPGWHFPGGGVKSGETVFEAIERETREETGAAINAPPELFGVYQNMTMNRRDHVVMFISRDFSPPGIEVQKSIEIAECRAFPLTDLPAQTTKGTRNRIGEILNGQSPTHHW